MFVPWTYTRSNREILIFAIGFRLAALCVKEVKDGAAKGFDGDPIWNLNDNGSVPFTSVNNVAKEWYVSHKTSNVLSGTTSLQASFRFRVVSEDQLSKRALDCYLDIIRIFVEGESKTRDWEYYRVILRRTWENQAFQTHFSFINAVF